MADSPEAIYFQGWIQKGGGAVAAWLSKGGGGGGGEGARESTEAFAMCLNVCIFVAFAPFHSFQVVYSGS